MRGLLRPWCVGAVLGLFVAGSLNLLTAEDTPATSPPSKDSKEVAAKEEGNTAPPKLSKEDEYYELMRIFADYTPLVEPISLDEAFLDVSASLAVFGDGARIGETVKQRVLDETGLVVSVGVATNKLCAKVASDLRKPDALVIVPPGEEAAFLAPLPIRRLWGVGPQAQAALAEYGVTTIGQLASTPRATLHRRFGRHGDDLLARARGIDTGGVTLDGTPCCSERSTKPSVL